MEGGAKILGHSIHPIMIVFPLGLLGTSVVFDYLALFLGASPYSTVAYWMILSGVIGGILAAAFGWIDWFAIPSGTRAKTIGLTHGMVNVLALVLFAASWYLRFDTPAVIVPVAVVISSVALVLALVGGWLGGELVERLGISVHRGAHVNAPSSLTTDDATATVGAKYAEHRN
jgi:uncharacterized membrane protein